MLSREEMIERMREAEANGTYHFYGRYDFDTLDDEKIQSIYMDMINYLSDARTHTDW